MVTRPLWIGAGAPAAAGREVAARGGENMTLCRQERVAGAIAIFRLPVVRRMGTGSNRRRLGGGQIGADHSTAGQPVFRRVAVRFSHDPPESCGPPYPCRFSPWAPPPMRL